MKSKASKAAIFAVNEIAFALVLLKVHFFRKECLGDVCVLHHGVRFAVFFVIFRMFKELLSFLCKMWKDVLTSYCQPRTVL
jgi:hypothetical protein